MDIARSVSFIEEKGSDLEKAIMRHILYGTKPEPEVIKAFIESQNRDGGFPCRKVRGNLSAVNDTLNALFWLDEMGMLESSTAGKAIGFLLDTQRDDGGWDEEPATAQYDLPPWITPGNLGTRVYVSSYAAYWLALKGYKAQPAFQAVLQFLLRHRDETGKFHGFLHSTWIATSIFLMAGDPYAQVVTEGLQVLTSRPLAEWVDSQICWALNCLGRAGLAKDHSFVEACLAELLRRRGTEGQWASEDGEAQAVGATIEALKALKRYGLLTAG